MGKSTYAMGGCRKRNVRSMGEEESNFFAILVRT